MYQFTRHDIGQFTVHESTPSVGDQHLKRFQGAVTPQNQATLNIYLSGQFRFTAGDFEQVLAAGQTSLDLGIAAFPPDVVCVERVIAGPARRYCVSKAQPGPWSRQRVDATDWTAPADGVLVGFDGALTQVQSGQIVTGRTFGMFCWAGTT